VAEYTGNCQLRSTTSPSCNTDVLRVCVRINTRTCVCVCVCVCVCGGGYIIMADLWTDRFACRVGFRARTCLDSYCIHSCIIEWKNKIDFHVLRANIDPTECLTNGSNPSGFALPAQTADACQVYCSNCRLHREVKICKHHFPKQYYVGWVLKSGQSEKVTICNDEWDMQ